MEVVGILKVKYDTQNVSEKFKKRDLVVTTDYDSPYPQDVQFQLTQDKCGLLDTFREGDMLKVQFNLRGREWNSPQGVKYFNTLEAWRVELVPGSMRGAPPVENQNKGPQLSTSTTPSNYLTPEDNDDLPF